MKDIPIKRWISVAAAAEYLSLHPMSVRKMIDRGQIPAVRIGRAVRVDLRALESGLNQEIKRQTGFDARFEE